MLCCHAIEEYVKGHKKLKKKKRPERFKLRSKTQRIAFGKFVYNFFFLTFLTGPRASPHCIYVSSISKFKTKHECQQTTMKKKKRIKKRTKKERRQKKTTGFVYTTRRQPSISKRMRRKRKRNSSILHISVSCFCKTVFKMRFKFDWANVSVF